MRHALFLAGLLVCLAVLPVIAQDAVKVDPKHNKVEIDNDQVRVLRFHLGPRESTAMHEHPAHVVVALTDGHLKYRRADGTTEERKRKVGEAVYRPALKHAVENLSAKDYEGIIVELKPKSQ